MSSLSTEALEFFEQAAQKALEHYKNGNFHDCFTSYEQLKEEAEKPTYDAYVEYAQNDEFKFFRDESTHFRNLLNERNPKKPSGRVMLFVDSKGMPRGGQRLYVDEQPACYAVKLQDMIAESGTAYSVDLLGQRYTTLRTISERMDEENIEGADLVIHSGIVDSINRTSNERWRYFCHALPKPILKHILSMEYDLKFQKSYMEACGAVRYLSDSDLQFYMHDIMKKASNRGARSVTWMKMLPIRKPGETESTEFRCNAVNFNKCLEELEQRNDVAVINPANLVATIPLDDFLLPDRIHFAPVGHNLMGEALWTSLGPQN